MDKGEITHDGPWSQLAHLNLNTLVERKRTTSNLSKSSRKLSEAGENEESDAESEVWISPNFFIWTTNRKYTYWSLNLDQKLLLAKKPHPQVEILAAKKVEEERKTGSLDKRLYFKYMSLGLGPFVLPLLIAVLIAPQIVAVYTEKFLLTNIAVKVFDQNFLRPMQKRYSMINTFSSHSTFKL